MDRISRAMGHVHDLAANLKILRNLETVLEP
jgi:hypothetical protein